MREALYSEASLACKPNELLRYFTTENPNKIQKLRQNCLCKKCCWAAEDDPGKACIPVRAVCVPSGSGAAGCAEGPEGTCTQKLPCQGLPQKVAFSSPWCWWRSLKHSHCCLSMLLCVSLTADIATSISADVLLLSVCSVQPWPLHLNSRS